MDKESSKDLKFDYIGKPPPEYYDGVIMSILFGPEVHDVAQEEYDKEHEVKGPE